MGISTTVNKTLLEFFGLVLLINDVVDSLWWRASGAGASGKEYDGTTRFDSHRL